MTAQPGQPQAVFTAGELDPGLHERRDLKYYFTGAKTMRNVEVRPQGGFRQAPGTRAVGRVFSSLTQVSFSGATLTAPAAGTAANVKDGDTATKLTTGAVSGASTQSVLQVVFAAPVAVTAVDVDYFNATITGFVAVEYLSGASWIRLQGRRALGAAVRSRRFSQSPTFPVTAQTWRVAVENLSGSGTVSIGEVSFWNEDGTFDVMRLRPFTSADGTVYDHLWQHKNVAVFGQSGFVANYKSPIPSGRISALRTTQSLDTMLAFEQGSSPQRVLRQGADNEWQIGDAPFTNIPNFDYGDVYVNGVAAKWTLEFIGFDVAPQTIAFTLTVAGQTTQGIKAPSAIPQVDWAALVTSIKTKLEATVVVAAGISVAKIDDGQIEVVFTGAGNELDIWTLTPHDLSFAGVPQVTARKIVNGAAGVPAVWILDFVNFAQADATGGSFQITVNKSGTDEETGAINFAVGSSPAETWTALLSVIKTAIENLGNVAPGITVTKVADAKLQVEFTGTGNGGDDWAIAGEVKNKADAAVVAYKDTAGVMAGEPIMSNARGWPRCGRFVQQRLLLGGFEGQPQTWMASVLTDYYNLDTSILSAEGAMLVPMDTDGNEAIEEIISSRSPLLLTSKAEYWLADRAISKATAPNHVQSSRHGVAEGIPVEENEGAAIFVGPNRDAVYEFRYNEVDQNFVTSNLSLLGSHLVEAVTDQAMRRAADKNDAAQLVLTKESGDLAIFSLLREQDVTAGTRRETDGQFVACHVNGANQIVVLAKRTIAGASQRMLERFEAGLLLDQAVTIVNSPAAALVSGLNDLDGETVWAIADGDVLGPFTVTGRQITLPDAYGEIIVGRWTPPYVETLPLPVEVAPHVVIERPRRIHTVRISLQDTTSLAIGANGGRIYEVPLFRAGDQLDLPSLDNKFTGTVTVQGLTGYSDKPSVVITQNFPGTLNVRGIVAEAA